MHNLFYELTLVCILAGGIAVVTSFFKQPTILAYIATGLLLGPLGYYNLQNSEIFTGLSEIGVTLLLFLIGLELDVSELKKMGGRAIVVGVGQVLLTTALGLTAMTLFGLSLVPAAFIAVALSFSSTVITTKLLAEKKDTQSLYGKLSLTILVIQDFFAIGLLVILNNVADPTTASNTWQNAVFLIAKLGILLWLVWWHNRFVFPKIMRTLGRSEELLLIFALAWALGLAALVSLPFIGLSREVGGFLAGLALAGTSLHYEISHRVKSLRDFFLILFFILLGANVSLDHTGGLLWPAIGLTAFVLVVKPLVVFVLLVWRGYKTRTAFLTGVSLSQVSEFSLILGALGLSLNLISPQTATLLTLVTIISIGVSSYALQYSSQLYTLLGPLLKPLERKHTSSELQSDLAHLRNHIILVGADRLGREIAHALSQLDTPFVIVDQNPDVAARYHEQNIPAVCGDITDSHIQQLIHLDKAHLVISTVPDRKDTESLVQTIKSQGWPIKLILTADDEAEAKRLYGQGVDYTLLPHFIGGLHLAKLIEEHTLLKSLKKLREQQQKRFARTA